MARKFDAPNADAFRFPVRISVNPIPQLPIKVDPTARVYNETFIQRPEFWEPLALNSEHYEKAGAVLVEEGDPKIEDSGLVRWVRTYATIPQPRDEFEQVNFTFPAYKATSASTDFERSGFSQGVVAKVSFSYLLTSNPIADFTINPIFHPKDVGGNKCRFVASDTTPTHSNYLADVTAGNFIFAKETEITRWRGNIYQAKNFQVVAL